MNKKLSLGGDKILVGESEIVIELSSEAIRILALDITLLLEGLIEKLNLGSSSERVEIQMLSLEFLQTTLRYDQTERRMKVALSRNGARYLQKTLLETYRDGAPSVNHVHLDGLCAGRSYDLTFLFDVQAPTIGADARAILKR